MKKIFSFEVYLNNSLLSAPTNHMLNMLGVEDDVSNNIGTSVEIKVNDRTFTYGVPLFISKTLLRNKST